ncbi:hypothetical protein SAMN06297387_116128 [Streptomyces zhaozhouensis]|uniref:Uncharacterized protein n=1 Tax=Streptomyces zhaozhouensis TaxID=1300267 RepID=A0A286E0J4_9ACTN|nr:hypothetical protein SAMN06297387_116128 [Streptomyces zhaozhouensis]
MPGAERIREATLRCVREEECADACWLRNPIELVEVLEPQLGAMSRRDTDELVRLSTANAARFAAADGGR